APAVAPPMGNSNAVSAQESQLMSSGMQSHSAGDTVGAQQAFRKVLQLDPQNTDAFFNLGALAQQQGDLQGALADYQSALKIAPDDSDLKAAVDSVRTKMAQAAAATAQAQQMASTQARQTNDLKALASDAATAYQNKKYSLAASNLEKVA